MKGLAGYGPWDYPKTVEGASFRVELGFHELRLWMTGGDKPRLIKTGKLQSPRTQPDGSTKLALQFERDLIIPTTVQESVKLVEALNALLGERTAAELRDEQAARELRQRLREGQRVRRRQVSFSLNYFKDVWLKFPVCLTTG